MRVEGGGIGGLRGGCGNPNFKILRSFNQEH